MTQNASKKMAGLWLQTQTAPDQTSRRGRFQISTKMHQKINAKTPPPRKNATWARSAFTGLRAALVAWIIRLCPRSWGPNFSGDFPVRRRDCYLHRSAGGSKAYSQKFRSTRFGAGAVAKSISVGYNVRDTMSEIWMQNSGAKFGGTVRKSWQPT